MYIQKKPSRLEMLKCRAKRKMIVPFKKRLNLPRLQKYPGARRKQKIPYQRKRNLRRQPRQQRKRRKRLLQTPRKQLSRNTPRSFRKRQLDAGHRASALKTFLVHSRSLYT